MDRALLMAGLQEDARGGGANSRKFRIDFAGEHLDACRARGGGFLGIVDMRAW
ncbi:MAG: hypothetical protein OXL68_16670 [Paracoccaceae bacterium]|nr:hypothetical protein [Paracoccaceae bacterium]